MEYIFIILFQVLGILTHVAQKIVSFDKEYPEKNFRQIILLFFENELTSLFASGVFVLLHLSTHWAIDYYLIFANQTVIIMPLIGSVPLGFISIIIAFMIGYAGQRIMYKYLGKAEEYLINKADNIK